MKEKKQLVKNIPLPKIFLFDRAEKKRLLFVDSDRTVGYSNSLTSLVEEEE